MDPNKTFDNLLDALLSGAQELAQEHADHLAHWIGQGCSVPQALTDAKTKRSGEQPPPTTLPISTIDTLLNIKPRADIPQLIRAPITFKNHDGNVTGHAKVSSVERVNPAPPLGQIPPDVEAYTAWRLAQDESKATRHVEHLSGFFVYPELTYRAWVEFGRPTPETRIELEAVDVNRIGSLENALRRALGPEACGECHEQGRALCWVCQAHEALHGTSPAVVELTHLEMVVMFTTALTELKIEGIEKIEGDLSRIFNHVAQQAYEHGLQTQLTPEQIQALCHNLSDTVSLSEFARGCAEYQCKLYGSSMPGTMISPPHILDLEMLRARVSTGLEKYMPDGSSDVWETGFCAAMVGVRDELRILIEQWRDNVPQSRAAEIVVNNEAPESEHHTSCPSYGREDEADVICNCDKTEAACHAGKDGSCIWKQCPQIRDGEPERSGRHCPLDRDDLT